MRFIKNLFEKIAAFFKRLFSGKGKNDTTPPEDFYPLF